MNEKNNNSTVNLVDLFFYLLSHWYLFVVCVAISVGFAYYRYSKMQHVFRSDATIIIKDPSNTQSTVQMGAYSSLINHVSMSNEILQLQSRELMQMVVTTLDADIDYVEKDDVVVANATLLAGRVEVGYHAFVSAQVLTVQPYVRQIIHGTEMHETPVLHFFRDADLSAVPDHIDGLFAADAAQFALIGKRHFNFLSRRKLKIPFVFFPDLLSVKSKIPWPVQGTPVFSHPVGSRMYAANGLKHNGSLQTDRPQFSNNPCA